MTLADLRRLSVRKQISISFELRNGMECVVDPHGVARVPALRRVPDFNLEEELASAREFRLEGLAGPDVRPRAVPRAELETMASAAGAGAAAAHEEE